MHPVAYEARDEPGGSLIGDELDVDARGAGAVWA